MAPECDQVEVAEAGVLGEEVSSETPPGRLVSPAPGQDWLQSPPLCGQSSSPGRCSSLPSLQVTQGPFLGLPNIKYFMCW